MNKGLQLKKTSQQQAQNFQDTPGNWTNKSQHPIECQTPSLVGNIKNKYRKLKAKREMDSLYTLIKKKEKSKAWKGHHAYFLLNKFDK